MHVHLNSCDVDICNKVFLVNCHVCCDQQNGPGIPAVLASVIINSSDLLRVDLTGIHVILPRLLSALEDLQQKFKFVL